MLEPVDSVKLPAGRLGVNHSDDQRVHVPDDGRHMGSRVGWLGKGDHDKVNVALAQRAMMSWEDSEEREHELRAALFGIEASAEELSRHRDHLTDRQFDELAQGLADEVRRLRGLLEGRSGASSSSSDLGDAIAPVIARARAFGLDVSSPVPRSIDVGGGTPVRVQPLPRPRVARLTSVPCPESLRPTRSDMGPVEDRPVRPVLDTSEDPTGGVIVWAILIPLFYVLVGLAILVVW